MNPDINFRPQSTPLEAIRISGHASILQLETIKATYTEQFNKYGLSDPAWSSLMGLNAVYILGFVSGARYAREKKRKEPAQ